MSVVPSRIEADAEGEIRVSLSRAFHRLSCCVLQWRNPTRRSRAWMLVFGERAETPGEHACPTLSMRQCAPRLIRCVAGSLAQSALRRARPAQPCRLSACAVRRRRSRAVAQVDRAFRRSGRHPNAAGAADRIEAILKTGVSFEDALTRVRHGRDYERRRAARPCSSAAIGHSTASSMSTRSSFPRPTIRRGRIRCAFQLHGGIARARPPAVNRIRVDALPSGGRRDSGVSGRVGAVDVVVGDAGRQPRAHPRSAEANLQHR